MTLQPNDGFFSEKSEIKPKKELNLLFPESKPASPKKKAVAVKATPKKNSVSESNKKQVAKPIIQTAIPKPVISQPAINPSDPYALYHSLTKYHKKCLIATNYWRVMNGLEIIPVPPEYAYYHKMFDKRCYDLYKQKKEHLEKLNAAN